MSKKQVLFICTHNSCRSQMAEGLLNQYCEEGFKASSAGVKQTRVHPLAIQVMDEINIDISQHRSKLIDEFRDTKFDYVVTVCDHAKETCPFFPAKKVLHKRFFDPGRMKGTQEEKLNAFRNVRDEIKEWIIDYFCTTE